MSQTLKILTCTFMALIGLSVAVSCSRAPDQYETTRPPQPERDLSDNPATLRQEAITNEDAGRLLGERPPLPQEEIDRRVRTNTFAPILYRQGAANITFDTTYQEAQDILGEPYGVSGSQHGYREGMVVYWRQEDPRIPDSIIIIIGYQGAISFPAPFNEVRVDQSFADAFSTGIADPSQDPRAQELLRNMYNHFEGTDIDCLAEGKCRLFLNEGGSFVVFELPNAYFLFGNNERRKLVQISLFQSKEPGLFRNPVDLLTGMVQAPRSEEAAVAPTLVSDDFDPAAQFGVGQTFEEVQQASGFGADAQIDSYSTYYAMRLGQGTELLLLFRKTDPTSERPLPTDQLMTIGMYPKFTQPLKFGSKFVGVSPNLLGGVSFSQLNELNNPFAAVTEEARTALSQPVEEMGEVDPVSEFLDLIRGDDYLSTKASMLARNFERQRGFTEGLFNFMKTQGERGLGEGWTSKIRISGLYDDRYSREIYGTVFFLNPENRDGRYVEMLINETNGDLTFFTSAMLNPYEKKTYFAGLEGHTAGDDHLMGFTLGDFIYATDFTYARAESTAYGDTAQQATIRYEDAELGTLVTRGSYKRDAESSVLYETGNERNITNQAVEVLEVPGATLGVNFVEEVEIDGKTWRKYEINVIETTSLLGEIRDLCGIPEFDATIGTFDRDFEQRFINLPAQARRDSQALRDRLQEALRNGQSSEDLNAGLSEEERALMNYGGCPAVSPVDPVGTNLRRAYYFANHHLKVVFSRRELVKVGIYKKSSAQTGGGQQ